MKSLVAVVLLGFLSGCVPAFKVQQADVNFSENKNHIFYSENNRISSKSIAGGIHIDAKGVYVNPYVEKAPETGAVVDLGMNIVNKTDYDTSFGATNQLGTIKTVVFRLPSGNIVTMDAFNQEIRTSDTIFFNSVTRSASYDQWETGTVTLSPEDFEMIATAESISAKIIGTNQSIVFEEKDISPAFLANMKRFYAEYVK